MMVPSTQATWPKSFVKSIAVGRRTSGREDDLSLRLYSGCTELVWPTDATRYELFISGAINRNGCECYEKMVR